MGYFKVVDGDFSPDWLGEGHFYFYSNIHEYVFMRKTGTMMLYRQIVLVVCSRMQCR